MSNPTCFDPGMLQDYLLGKLSDEQSDAVAAHLEACLSCEATISQLDRASDTLTNGLRLQPASTEPATDDALQRALDRVQSLEPADEYRPNSEVSASRSPVLRDYRLLEPLGSGGMGQVFKAVHTRLDRLVAVKLLPARRLCDEQAVTRFQREMRVIGQLSHPAIVQATDAGEVDGTHFLVMEYVEGCDLNALAKVCGPLSVADACEIARQAALGLEYAHQQGIVHRDIKPSNLMLARGEGRGAKGEANDQPSNSPLAPPPSPLLKILDLGLALLSGEQAPVDELTTVGQLMGTLDYMAPEQLEDSHLVGPRADIYALAATLFRLLTEAAPFAKNDRKTPLQKLRALATLSAPPIRERRADLPAELATIIDRALSRDSAQRFATMTEFASALAPWCAGHDLTTLVGHVNNVPAPTTDVPSFRVDRRSHVRQNVGELPTDPRSGERGYEAKVAPLVPSGHDENVPHGAPPRRSKLGTLLALVALFVLGVVITIETNKGRLIVESVRDGVEVRIKKSGRVVERLEVSKTAKSTKLAAGEYEIELVGDADGLRVDRQRVELSRGGEVLVRVTEVPAIVSTTSLRPSNPQPGAGVNPTVGSSAELSVAGALMAGAPVTEPDDEKPNPTAKSIDQFLAESPDQQAESKYRDAMRRKIDFDFSDTPLSDVIPYLQEKSQLPMWIDVPALTEDGITTDLPITKRLIEANLGTTLLLTLRPLQLTSYWDGTSVAITTMGKAKEKLINRSYPVGRSLPMVRKAVRLINEQQAREAIINVHGGVSGKSKPAPTRGGGFFAVPTGMDSSEIVGGDQRNADPPFHRQSGGPALRWSHPTVSPTSPLTNRLHFQFGGGGGGGFGVVGGGEVISSDHTVVSYYEDLLALLTDASWQNSDGDGGTVSLLGDVLFVRQTRPAHEQVEAALRLLELAAAGPLANSPVEIRRPDYPFEADRKVVAKLSENISFDQLDVSLTDALDFLSGATSIPILIEADKLNDEAIAADTPVSLTLANQPLQAVLHRLLEPLQLSAEVEEGLLIVTTKNVSKERLVTRVYEVRELLARGIEGDELIHSLEAGTEGPWMISGGEGGEATVFADRLLFVTQTRAMHDEIAAFLRDLHKKLGQQPAKKPGSSQPKPKPAPQPQGGFGGGSAPTNEANQPRYDGKTFEEWFAILDTERSPARLGDAVEALKLLGPEAEAAKVAERLLSLSRVIDLGPDSFSSNSMNLLRGKIFEYFNKLPDGVSQKSRAKELRSGTTRSRLFVLTSLIGWDQALTEDFASAILGVCRDSDAKVRVAAVNLLQSLPLEGNLAKLSSQRTTQFRQSLSDSEQIVVLRAAMNLLDSEADSSILAAALARIVAKPRSNDLRLEALNLIAVLGSRATSVATQVADVLLEKNDGMDIHMTSEPHITESEVNRWLGPFQDETKHTWRLVATVALARMGKDAAAALPKIDEALKAPVPKTESPTNHNPSWVDADQKGHSLDWHVLWPNLLRAARTRIEAPAAIDLRGNDPQALASALRLAAWHHKLLQMEQALLEQYRGPGHASVVALAGAIQQANWTFTRLIEFQKNRQAFQNTTRNESTGKASAKDRIARLEEPTWGAPTLTELPTGLVLMADSPRVIAIKELGQLGAAARDALPVLKKELESKDNAAAEAAKKAIEQIESDKEDKKAE